VKHDYSYPLRVAADKYGDRTAFVYRDERWSFRAFDRATDRLAAAFAARGLTGERVVLLLQNEPTTVMVSLALARVGAIAVPVNPRLLQDEIAFIVDDSRATVLIADEDATDVARELRERCDAVASLFTVHADDVPEGEERIEDLLASDLPDVVVDVDPSSIASIIYTSGTSGFPKGVAKSHEANVWACVNAALGQPRTTDDTEIFVLPLFGVAFIFQVMPMILSGGTVVLDRAFNASRTWELLERHRATRIFLAPTMINSMLDVEGHEARDVSALRVLNTAYEFPEPVRRRTHERFGDIVAYMYGLTEAQLCCSTTAEFATDPTGAGHPMGMMRVRIVDEQREPVTSGVVGEIAFEGPALMSGYDGRDEATAEALIDGWLYTGDLGFLDDEGRIHVTGRKKEMIKTGGFSVDPIEVEQAIVEFPGVREAAVIGVPDDHWGEVVVAFVAGTPDVEGAEADLVGFLRSRMTGYKCPKRIEYVSELPKNPTGKIARGELRKLAATVAP
jgi:acyl-CoA synthetase (AMP-forming)/AMP-acid ligase II